MCALVGIEGIMFTVITTESEVSKIVNNTSFNKIMQLILLI